MCPGGGSSIASRIFSELSELRYRLPGLTPVAGAVVDGISKTTTQTGGASGGVILQDSAFVLAMIVTDVPTLAA